MRVILVLGSKLILNIFIIFQDFFINNGRRQPGCFFSSCSHARAPKIFVESINSNDFYAQRCDTFGEIKQGCHGELVTMGGEPANAKNSLRGIFHLTTNRREPFAQGKPSTSHSP